MQQFIDPYSGSSIWVKERNFIVLLDSKSVVAQHLTGKILNFDFYPKAVNFECKF